MIEIDIHEKPEALTLIGPSVPCRMLALNEDNWGDYRWRSISGRWTNVERKTWPEVLANIDAVEDQLRRHMRNQPDARLLFVLEGMVDVDPEGTYILHPTAKHTLWNRGYRSGTRIGRIYSWLYNASEYVEVFQTFSYELTCQFLVQAYNQDQKKPEEHKTFNRYYKRVVFHPNPQVMQLMGLLPGIGEVKCEALIDRFTTVWQVLNASPGELMQVEGIGTKLSLNLLQRIGRTDV